MTNTNLLAALGLLVRIQRDKETQISLRELARRSGLSVSTVFSIENGSHPATIETLDRIARVLDLPLGRLIESAETLAKSKSLDFILKKRLSVKVRKADLHQSMEEILAQIRRIRDQHNRDSSIQGRQNAKP